jgi:probable HAF family extracellular repeat protein
MNTRFGSWLRPATFAVAVFLASTPLAMRAVAATYTFTTLDNNADPTFNQLLGINSAGTIAGYFGVGSATHPNKGYTLAPPYTQASYTNENFPGSVQTQVVGINSLASPVTVGFWIDGNNNNFGFVDQNGTFTSVSDPNTSPTAPFTQLLGVNNSDIAAGFYVDLNGNAQGFTYNIATAQFTPVMDPNGTSTTATGINTAGLISGFFTDANGNVHGFLDNNGTFTTLDDPNGTNTMILGLNNTGDAVGSFMDANGMTNGFVYNYLTNTWQTVDDPHASPNAAFDVTGTTINGLNDQGQLVGFYSDGTNVDGFLATPTPEPGSLAIVAAGLVALALRTKRKSIDR